MPDEVIFLTCVLLVSVIIDIGYACSDQPKNVTVIQYSGNCFFEVPGDESKPTREVDASGRFSVDKSKAAEVCKKYKAHLPQLKSKKLSADFAEAAKGVHPNTNIPLGLTIKSVDGNTLEVKVVWDSEPTEVTIKADGIYGANYTWEDPSDDAKRVTYLGTNTGNWYTVVELSSTESANLYCHYTMAAAAPDRANRISEGRVLGMIAVGMLLMGFCR